MTMRGLAVANLFRHPARTFLTFASLSIAFLLFMLLSAISAAFSSGATVEGDDRFIVDAKYSMADNLPVSYVSQVRALPGVEQASAAVWFGGYYQDPKQTFTTLAVDPRPYFEIYAEFGISDDALDQFAEMRTGAVASDELAARYRWTVGDKIVLRGDIWPKEDGSWDWEFDLVGTFSPQGGALAESMLLVRQDYFNDAAIDWAKDQVGLIVAKASDAAAVETLSAEIDRAYENSSDPTRTASEDQYTRQFVSRLGDIGLMSTIIMSAVFFTLLLLTGNTAAQTFRERVPELAAMKTLGFTDRAVSRLVLLEILTLCLAGSVAGIVLAFLLEPVLTASLGQIFGGFSISIMSAFAGLGIAVLIGLLIGFQPAWSARRLTIVDALRAQ